MIQLAITNLEVGMVLAQDIIDDSGRILYAQGAILTERHIRRLRETNKKTVPVQSKDANVYTPVVLPPVHPVVEAPVTSSSKEKQPTIPFSNAPSINRTLVRSAFQHSNINDPFMQKIYQECLNRFPLHESYQAATAVDKPRRTPLDLVKGLNKVVILPSVYARLNELINDPESSSRDFAAVVNDSGLAAIILKTANSAFFGMTKKVDTLSQAVTILGTKQLCDLVLASTVIRTFESIPQELVNVQSFCHHSIACGVFAREIAATCRLQNTERFFTAGLLHDVGRLVLFSKCPAEYRKVLKLSREFEELLYICERKIFGFDHTDVGAILLEQWNLPYILQEAVQYHHNPHQAPTHSMEALVVHFADVMANAFQYGTSGEHLVPPLSPDVMERLSLSPAEIPSIANRAHHQIEQILKLILPDEES